jgi:chaperonin cofactor prefoldin
MPPCYSSFTIQDEVADALFEAAGSPKTKEDAERTREHCKAVSDECDRQERMTREKIAELENKIAGLRARCSQAYSIRDAHRSLSVWVKDKIK